MENCTQGHPILQNQGTCEHGDSAAPAAPTAGQQLDPVAMMLQTQQMMQATMQQLMQNLNLATPSPTQGAWVKWPDRPTIDADTTDSD